MVKINIEFSPLRPVRFMPLGVFKQVHPACVISHVHMCPTVRNLNVRLCFSIIMTTHQCCQSIASWPIDTPLLPCLPPASTLQVDVNGDAERPPRRCCPQEHAHSCLSYLLVRNLYIHLTSSFSIRKSDVRKSVNSWSVSSAAQWLNGLDGSISTREPLLFTKAQRWMQELSTRVCFYRNHHR